MALPTTEIKLSAVAGMFASGKAGPHKFSEFYKGGTYVPTTATNPYVIPTAGAIGIGNFRGAQKALTQQTLNMIGNTDINQTLPANFNASTVNYFSFRFTLRLASGVFPDQYPPYNYCDIPVSINIWRNGVGPYNYYYPSQLTGSTGANYASGSFHMSYSTLASRGFQPGDLLKIQASAQGFSWQTIDPYTNTVDLRWMA